MTGRAARRSYLDVLRGIAVLVMIEAHVIDSWTRAADRGTAFGWSIILGGFGAPLFLFLAGVAVPLSAASKARRLGDDRAAALAVQKRGLEIFLLAFLFRVQAMILSGGAAATLLRVDILNIMGPAIVATAWLWSLARSPRARVLVFVSATLAIAWATPIVRAFGWLAALPDPIEGYIRPVRGLTNFSMFPWGAFVPAGAIAGTLIASAPAGSTERRLNIGFAVGGIALAMLAGAASFLPTPYPHSDFWTSSPSFFFLRTGIMIAMIGLVYAWEQRHGWIRMDTGPGEQRQDHLRVSRALRLLGQTSLFIYWIHVEMVYGLISLPLHGALTLGQAWAALGLFCVFMLGCAALKVRVADWWGRGGPGVLLGRQTPSNIQKQA